MTLKHIIGMSGLTVLLVFTLALAWEFGFEPAEPQSAGIADYNLNAVRAWYEVVAATIAAAVASVVLGVTGYRWAKKHQDLAHKLTENSGRFRDFAESASDWFWELDRDLRVISLSDAFLKKLSLNKDEILGTDHLDLWHRFDEQNRRRYAEAIENRQPIRNIRFDTVLPNGRALHFRINGKPIFDDTGEFQGYRGTGQDITIEIATRRKQQEAEAYLRNAIEAISEGLVMFDADDRLILCNSKYRELFSMTKDLWVPGAKFEDLIRAGLERGQYPLAVGREEEWFANRIRQFHNTVPPFERKLPNGRWVKVSDTRTADGYMVGIRSDITDLITREEELRESEERYRRLIELSPDGIMVVCEENIVFCNSALMKILGAWSPKQLIGRRALDFVPTNDHATIVRRRENARKDQGRNLREAKNIRIDGKEIDVEKSLVSITWQGKEAFLVLMRDITERKRREEQLRQTQKMEALGTLAGGIAHDLNNTLVPIVGLTDMMLQDLPEASDVRENLKIVAMAAERGQDLVEQILKFSRSEDVNRVPVDLSAIVRDTLPLLRATLPATIEICANIDSANTLTVNADAVQIHQILMNLASNASHAMGLEAGTLAIGLEPVDVDAVLTARHPKLQFGHYVKLTVSDTGPGIETETLDRIFDPFFTTKDVGEGTGLGLSVVHAVVEAHGGVIIGSSAPGQGATFTIYLPLESGERAQTEAIQVTA